MLCYLVDQKIRNKRAHHVGQQSVIRLKINLVEQISRMMSMRAHVYLTARAHNMAKNMIFLSLILGLLIV